jgi:protein-tyrosine phosphatase
MLKSDPETTLIIGGCAIHGRNFKSKEAYDAHMKAKHPVQDDRQFTSEQRQFIERECERVRSKNIRELQGQTRQEDRLWA